MGGWGADEAPCKQKWATLVFISFGSHALLNKSPPAVSQSSRLLSVSVLWMLPGRTISCLQQLITSGEKHQLSFFKIHFLETKEESDTKPGHVCGLCLCARDRDSDRFRRHLFSITTILSSDWLKTCRSVITRQI